MTINSDIIKGNLEQFLGKAKKLWGKLTDDDWIQVKGDMQILRGKLQESYGYSAEEADKEIQSLQNEHHE